ncbi:MAG: DUF4282 domain-containing protein [Alphaproteobacteria bacterium]
MGYVLTFRHLLAPVLIRIIYYIGAALIVIEGVLNILGINRIKDGVSALPSHEVGPAEQYLYNFSSNPWLVLISIPIALILWRVWCEVWIVIFQIDDRLGEIRDSLKGQ